MAAARFKVLHLIGSAVDDFHADLSRVYAAECLDATHDPDRYAPQIAFVSPDGSWRFPSGLGDAELDAAQRLTLHEALAILDATRPDVVVPQMFCPPGMTRYRALFQLLGIPSVGNSATVMAIAMDKVVARAIVASAGVLVPEAAIVRRGDEPTVVPPVVVKPATADNSAGVSLVRRHEDLGSALEAAFKHGERAIVERFIELGREVRCGTIVRGDELIALPLEEYAVDAATKPIRDTDDKLARDVTGRLRLVAKDPRRAWIVPVDDPLNEVVAAAALACHVALGCGHHGLFDFRIDPDGRPWFLEAGPYCSFGRSSVVPTMAAAFGIPISELFADAVSQALARASVT